MNRDNAVISLEIRWIVLKNAIQPLDFHSCHEPGIMDLNSFYIVLDNKFSPLRIYGGGVGHQGENWIQARQLAFSFCRG